MKRFELIYNGVSSIFNASESGNGYTSKHNKALSYWVVYTVRPSKTNTLGISKLFEQHNEDGSVRYSFNARTRVEPGFKVVVKELGDC